MNADAILIMGSNMAENHPVGFQWVMEAKERGAKIIHVDPRFSRTSSVADIWAPLRAGSDILLLGALVNYVLQNGKEFREYVVSYTNASVIIQEDFQDTEDLDGLFSGWDSEGHVYDPQSWAYANSGTQPDNAELFVHMGYVKEGSEMAIPDINSCERDETLENPRCVYQILKRHFERYTPEMIELSCGVPQTLFLKIAETFCSASGPENTAAVCYALGWTQHSDGVQIIRTAAILQLLLGNIGRPGGGIMALRGHASIQGSTDIPTLYDILPGYLPMPKFKVNSHDLATYLSKHQDKT